ncbi:MAG: hypothetical protein IT324_28805 [Anaerolineae bacterium]|nr:hypothetical protein [Anaerolineae bacterium]
MNTRLYCAILFAWLTLLLSLHYTTSKGWAHHEELQGDYYTDLALNGMIRNGQPTAYRFPVYPLALGVWLRAFGGEPGARVFQSVLAAYITFLTVALTARESRLRGACVAGVVMTINGALYDFASMLITELFFTFLLLLLVVMLRRWRARSVALTGALMGVLLLTRGTLLPTVPLIVGLIAPRRRLLFIGLMVIVCVPWIIRNVLEMHTFIPFSTGTGYVLLGANNPQVYAATWRGWPSGSWINDHTAEVQTIGLNEVGQDREATRRALDYARSQTPTVLLNVALARLANFCGAYDPVWALPPLLVSLVAIITGAARLRYGDKRTAFICIVMITGAALNAVIFWGGLRFRFPVEPLLAILAGVSVGSPVRRSYTRKQLL